MDPSIFLLILYIESPLDLLLLACLCFVTIFRFLMTLWLGTCISPDPNHYYSSRVYTATEAPAFVVSHTPSQAPIDGKAPVLFQWGQRVTASL